MAARILFICTLLSLTVTPAFASSSPTSQDDFDVAGILEDVEEMVDQLAVELDSLMNSPQAGDQSSKPSESAPQVPVDPGEMDILYAKVVELINEILADGDRQMREA